MTLLYQGLLLLPRLVGGISKEHKKPSSCALYPLFDFASEDRAIPRGHVRRMWCVPGQPNAPTH
jgi:hypothetical protein